PGDRTGRPDRGVPGARSRHLARLSRDAPADRRMSVAAVAPDPGRADRDDRDHADRDDRGYADRDDRGYADRDILLASRSVGGDVRQTDLSVPTIHCGGCIRTIERTLGGLPGVEHARVNLSTKRVSVRWHGEAPPPLLAALRDAGYDAHLHDA